ncbi:MAG: SDR family oxidoreductase [Gammaproteobacteria bacterium]|nr:SDR family oxidoreductase [Gammaproteobacteria bacterium]
MEDKPDNSVLIVGCGDVGKRVALRLQGTGHAVAGVVRSAAGVAQLQSAGIAARQCDLDVVPLSPECVAGCRDIFYFAPPPGEGNNDPRMAGFLAALDKQLRPRRLVYISTSAVYGDCQGEWITETQPPDPTTPRGVRRLAAERCLQAWAGVHGVQWIILRVPGIYGPGKLPLARLEKGLPVLREADAPWTNRIHADDLAAVCVAAMASEHTNTVYNVSDGCPSNMTDYFFRVADAAGLPRPPAVSRAEAEQVLSAGMLSFLRDSRRMDNHRMLEELEIELQYPDLAAGLAACFTGRTPR